MDNESYLMLSGIQHFMFCKRQWALIHIEQLWEENVRTIEGNQVHQRVDQPMIKEKRGDVITIRSIPVKSDHLRLTGICDLVEFIYDDDGIEISGYRGKYKPFPIEYKKGKPKYDESDKMQLIAQVIALEEMLLTDIKRGFFYYDEIKRRKEVLITEDDRIKVKKIADEMQNYFRKQYTPKVKTGNFCRSCSLINLCLPELMNKESVSVYIERKIKE